MARMLDAGEDARPLNVLYADDNEANRMLVQAILQSCSCAHGCADCSPPEVLEAGPDKAGVLRLLGA